tara:strand:+ start:118143 stop:118844 length:702 start_codon:yes stop_codon:yes gene_type:complete
MAKYWTPGKVKTRLGASVGAEVAACLHRQFVMHLCDRLAHAPGIRELVVAPASAVDCMADELTGGWRFVAQNDGDLGDRMRTWFATKLAEPACEKAVLIGADCPNLKPQDIRTAFDRLDRDDIVLGPANDGGYYLIGLHARHREQHEDLFTHIPWSSEDVLEITQNRAQAADLTLSLLPMMTDVDELSDLQQLCETLALTRHSDPGDGELADQIHRLVPVHRLVPAADRGPRS